MGAVHQVRPFLQDLLQGIAASDSPQVQHGSFSLAPGAFESVLHPAAQKYKTAFRPVDHQTISQSSDCFKFIGVMHDRMPQWISKWSSSALCLQAVSLTCKLVWKTTTVQPDRFWDLQGVASTIYPPESLGDFTQTLFLQGKTSQSTFRCKLALFLYCLLDRQSGAGGHKLKLESFRCTILHMCASCQSVLCRCLDHIKNTIDLHIKQHRELSIISAVS